MGNVQYPARAFYHVNRIYTGSRDKLHTCDERLFNLDACDSFTCRLISEFIGSTCVLLSNSTNKLSRREGLPWYLLGKNSMQR